MSDTRLPYGDRGLCELILRDHLAIDRTILANERTLLAYVRTALTLLVLGASFIKFFGSMALEIVGWSFLPFALSVFVLGVWRYYRMAALVEKSVSAAHKGSPATR